MRRHGVENSKDVVFSNPILSSVMCVLRCTEVGVLLVTCVLIISSTTSSHVLQLIWQPSLRRPVNLMNLLIYGNHENPALQDSILTSRGKDCYGGYYRRPSSRVHFRATTWILFYFVLNYSTKITGATQVKFSHRRHSIVFEVIDIAFIKSGTGDTSRIFYISVLKLTVNADGQKYDI